MKLFNSTFTLLVLITLPISATAETVYKSIDENGATVFSDEKTPDAKKINVHPNVIGVDIPDMPASAPHKAHKPNVMQTTHGTTSKNQSVEIGSGTSTAGNLKRKIRNLTNGEGIKRPVTRPAVRAGGHR